MAPMSGLFCFVFAVIVCYCFEIYSSKNSDCLSKNVFSQHEIVTEIETVDVSGPCRITVLWELIPCTLSCGLKKEQ